MEQELTHHREEVEDYYRELHTPLIDTLTILSENDNYANSNHDNNNNNHIESHKDAVENVATSQTKSMITPEKIINTRKQINTANEDDNTDDIDNMKRPHCRHGLVEDEDDDEEEDDERKVQAENVEMRCSNNDANDTVEEKDEVQYKSNALLCNHPPRRSHRRHRLNSVNNLSIMEYVEEQEESIAHVYEIQNTNRGNRNEEEMETCAKISHLNDQQELISADHTNSTNIVSDSKQKMEKEIHNFESSATWNDYFIKNAVRKVDCTTYTEMYAERVANTEMSMYKVINTYQLLHEAMLKFLRQKEHEQENIMEEEQQCSQVQKEQEKRKILIERWCASFVSKAIQLQTLYESLSLMPDALSQHTNKTQLSTNVQNLPCMGINSVHVDDTYRIIVEIQVEPFTISLNDLIAFHVRPFSINEIKIIMQSIILHLLHIVDLFVLHEKHFGKRQEKEKEQSSTCEKDAMTISSALENIVRQLHGGNILFSSHDGSVTFTVLPELGVPVNACRHDSKYTTTTMEKTKVENNSNTNKEEYNREESMEIIHLPICLSNIASEQAIKLQVLAQNLREIQEANSKGNNTNNNTINNTYKIDGQTVNDTNVTSDLESMAQYTFFSTERENQHVARHIDADVCTHTSTKWESQHQLRLDEIVHQVKHALAMISLSLLLGYPTFHTATLEHVIELHTSNVCGNNSNDDKEESKYMSYINKLIDMAITFSTKEAKEELEEEKNKEEAVNSTLVSKRIKEGENEEQQEQKRQYNELKQFILSCLCTIDGSECEEQSPPLRHECTMKMVYHKVHHLLRHPFFRKPSSIHVQKGNILSPLENTEEEVSTHDAGMNTKDYGDDDKCSYNMEKEKEHLLEVHDAVHRIIYPIYTYLSRIKEHVNCTTFSSPSSSSSLSSPSSLSSEPLENCFYQVRAHRNSIFAARSTFVEQCCANQNNSQDCHNYWWPAESNKDTSNEFVKEPTISSLGGTQLTKNRDQSATTMNTTNAEAVKLTIQSGNNAQGSIDYITHTFTLTKQSHKTFCITRKQAEELFFRPNRSCNSSNNVVKHVTERYVDTIVLSHLTSCHVQILYPVKNIILDNLYNCVICVGPSHVCYIGHDCQSSVLHIASAYLCTADDVRIKQPSHETNVDSLNEKCNEMSCSHNTSHEKKFCCLEWHWIGNVILDSAGKRVALNKTNILPYCLTYPGLSANCGMVNIKSLCNFSRYNPEIIWKSNTALQLLAFHGLVNASHDYPFAHMLSYASESFVHLDTNDKDTCYYYNSELHNKDVYISNVHGSCTCTGSFTDYENHSHFPFIIILDTVREVNVTDCSHCTLVVIGSVGSVSLHSCHDMYCIFASRESVVSQSYNLIIHALVTEFLLMEECHDAAILPLYVECPWFDRIMSAIVAESSYHNYNNSNNEKEKKKKKKQYKEENIEIEKEDVDSSSSTSDSASYSTAHEINYAYETRSVLLLNILLQAYASSETSRGVSFVECVNVELYTSEFYRLHEHVLPIMIIIPFSVMHATANVHIKPKTTVSGEHVECNKMESFNSHVKSECNVAENILAKQIVITHQVSNSTQAHWTEMLAGTSEMYACTLFKEWCIDNDVDYRIAFERKSLQECLYFHITSALTLFEENRDNHHHYRRNDNHRSRHRHRHRNRNREEGWEEQIHSEEWKQSSTFALTDTDDEENDDTIDDDDDDDDDKQAKELDKEMEERNRLIHISFMHVVEYKIPHIYFGNLLGVHLYRPAETLLPFSFNVHGHTLCDVTLDNITAHETYYKNNLEEELYPHNEKSRKNKMEMPNYIIITQPLRHVVLRHVNGPMHVLFTAVSHITMIDCQEITLYAVCKRINCINCHSCHVALHTNTPPEFVNCTFMEYSVWNVALDDMHLTNTVDTDSDINCFVNSATINDANLRRNLYKSERAKVSLYEAVQRQYALLSIDVEVNLVHRAISKKLLEHLEKQHTLQITHNKRKQYKEAVKNDKRASKESLYQISPWPFQHTINAHNDTHYDSCDDNNNVFSLHTLYNAIVYTSPLPLTEIVFECCETKTNWQDHAPYAKKTSRPVINNNNNNTNSTSSSTNKIFTSLMCAMPEVMYRRVETEQLTFRQRWERSLNAECNADANRTYYLEEEWQNEETGLYAKTCFYTHLCRALDEFVKHMKEINEKYEEKFEQPLTQEVQSESLKLEMDSHCINKQQQNKHADSYKTDDNVKLDETVDHDKINELVKEKEEVEVREVNDNESDNNESNDQEKITLLHEVSGGVNDEGVNININEGDIMAAVVASTSAAAENQSPYENTLSYSPSSQLQEHKMPVILHRASSSVNEHVDLKQNKCQEKEEEEDKKERVHTEKNNDGNSSTWKVKLESEKKETEQHEMYEHDMINDNAINTATLENEKVTQDIILIKPNISSMNDSGNDDHVCDKDKESNKCQNEVKNGDAELHENDPSHTEQNYPSTETEDTSAVSVSTAIKECFQTGRAIAVATHDTILKETHEMATPLPTNQRPASPSLSRHSSSSSSESLVSTEFSNLVQTDAAHDTYRCQYVKNWHDSNISFSSSSSKEESSSSSLSLVEKRRRRNEGEEDESDGDVDDTDGEHEHRRTPYYAMQNETHKQGKKSDKMFNLGKNAKNNDNNKNRHTKRLHVDDKKNTHTYEQIANEALSPFASSSSLSSSSSKFSSSTSLSTPPASTHELDVCEDDKGLASRRKTNNNNNDRDRDEQSTYDEEVKSSDEERSLQNHHNTQNYNEHEGSTFHQQHNRVIPLCTPSAEQLLRHAFLNHYQQQHNEQEQQQHQERTFTTNNHDHHDEQEEDEEGEESNHHQYNNSESNDNNEHDNHINHATHRSHSWSSSYGPNNDIAHRSRLLQVFEEVVIARAAYRAFSAQLEQTHALLERIRRVSRLLEEQRRLRYAQLQSSNSDEQWSSESEQHLHNEQEEEEEEEYEELL